MTFDDLDLWKDEEKKIHACIATALSNLAVAGNVNLNDNEDAISARLHPLLWSAKKKYKLNQFIVRRQIAVYKEPTDAKPNGYPDFGFFWMIQNVTNMSIILSVNG